MLSGAGFCLFRNCFVLTKTILSVIKNHVVLKSEIALNKQNRYLDNKIKINNIVPCDNNFYYRNKTTFQVKECIGFYKNNTYDFLLIDNPYQICQHLKHNVLKTLHILKLHNYTFLKHFLRLSKPVDNLGLIC